MDRFEATNKRSVRFIFLILFFGLIIGSMIGKILVDILPDGTVVEQFFEKSIEIGWDPFPLELGIIIITTGFEVVISVCSLMGLFISWYFLRYFK